jgi:hypothetical protein
VLTAIPVTARAGDAAWMVCSGVAVHKDKTRTYLAASVVEHRANDGDGRTISVTLLKGVNVSVGDVDKKGVLKVRSIENKRVVFTGSVVLPDDLKTVTFTGKLDNNYGGLARPALEDITAKLTCSEELNDAAVAN